MLQKMKMKLKEKKGFTLMEMLIVVAIIAILLAIMIPAFSGALTDTKLRADQANARAYYAEAMSNLMAGDGKVIAFKGKLQASASAAVTPSTSVGSVASPETFTVTYTSGLSGNKGDMKFGLDGTT